MAADFVGPVFGCVLELVGPSIIRQFNYLCCFISNIDTLKDEGQKLDDETKELQQKVDRARDNLEIIVPAVETWLRDSEEIRDEMNGILREVPNVENVCLKLRARFSLSKRAKKTTDRIIEFRGQKHSDPISYPRRPPARGAVPLGPTFDFSSRKQIEEDIMTRLRDTEDTNMIGIWGMGGLGKTTMAKMIMNRAWKDDVFKEVVMAVVSQSVDKSKIQEQIGGQLGLKNLKDETLSANRVKMIHDRLIADKKRILLVLDDVWENLAFEEDLGIPRDCKDCKILLTSRDHGVLRAMNVEVFGMKELSENDAWSFFRGTAGTCVDDIGLNSIAKEVVEECKGLPIALSIVGAALKDEKDKRIWKHNVTQLRQANPTDIPDFIKKVYNPLRLSYDKLESENKFIFLLCCLFREDADIRLDYLTYFCMGLGIFEGGIRNFEERRNKMCTLTKMLKRRSLLLDGRNEDYVRMHDVVRDFGKFIAKHERYIDSNSDHQLFTSCGMGFPNVRLLFFSPNSEMGEEIKFDNSFIEGIRDLHVLFIENYSSLTSLPSHTTESLRNLKTLVLNSCRRLETISFVGELVHLEILVCHHCYSIKELPPEMKRLNRLKLLDLTYCGKLQRIGGGIISSLVGLEELKMLHSFNEWDSNESENGNATVRELEALTNLRCLEIEIDDPALAAQNMRLSSKLDRFQIRIEPDEDYDRQSEFYSFNKTMSLKWEGETCVGEWIEILIRDAECLHLRGNSANNVDYLAKSQNIRWLELEECETMKNIGRTSMDDATVFPHMEYLKLDDLPQLEEILDGTISSNSFHNLNELQLKDLPALKKLWKNSGSSPVFHNLSSIYIWCCPKLEEILDGPISSNSFPNLEELKLENLRALKQLWKSSSSPVFHNLSSIYIWDCPKLEEILDGPISSNSFHNLKELDLKDLPALKQLWKSSSSPVFHNLSSIYIDDCPCLRNLGQLSSIAENNCLSQLQFLTVKDCEMIEQVFLWNEEDQWRITKLMFPKLESILLHNLPNLVTLCQGIGGIEFPLLTEMSIEECPKMKSMVSSEENNCGGSRNADIDDYHSPPLFCQPQNVSFDNLKILAVEGNALYCQKIPVSFFHGLEELTVCGYKGSTSLFTFSIAQNFVNLRGLSIRKCYEIVKVIKDEQEEKAASGGERPLLFPKLEKLELTKLESFCEWNCDVKCSIMKFDGCSNYMIKIFNLGSNVSFSFHGLEELRIARYEGSMSLFSSSILAANILVSLRKLEISSCKEMVKVIEDEKEEENVVSSGGAQTTTTILFPKLQELELKWLWKLESFCEWKCDIELPSLRKVAIIGCSNMKIFSRGLITPNLESVEIDRNEVLESGEKDLNGALEQRYLAREKVQQQSVRLASIYSQ